MHLTHSISPDRRTLTIHADERTRILLRELSDALNEDGSDTFGSDTTLFDVFENLTCNSDLEWIRPEVCYDLTDAPILGILGSEEEAAACTPEQWAAYRANRNGSGIQYDRPVIERWGFMAYAVRGVLEDLRDTGKAVFTAP